MPVKGQAVNTQKSGPCSQNFPGKMQKPGRRRAQLPVYSALVNYTLIWLYDIRLTQRAQGKATWNKSLFLSTLGYSLPASTACHHCFSLPSCRAESQPEPSKKVLIVLPTYTSYANIGYNGFDCSRYSKR